ncbi:MAG: hypothetical protein HQ572_06420 [Candidatus Omnitrophica bacterium]|nr:hypothetical protein [Candidatus Omnitrophota bacterium]
MNRILIYIIAIFMLAVTVGRVEAKDVAAFVYESGGRRDPFVPLVNKEGKLMVTYGVISSINDVVLEGILYDDKGQSVAIMNDLVLKENDQVGSIIVKKIERDRVILIYNDKEYTIKLKE